MIKHDISSLFNKENWFIEPISQIKVCILYNDVLLVVIGKYKGLRINKIFLNKTHFSTVQIGDILHFLKDSKYEIFHHEFSLLEIAEGLKAKKKLYE